MRNMDRRAWIFSLGIHVLFGVLYLLLSGPPAPPLMHIIPVDFAPITDVGRTFEGAPSEDDTPEAPDKNETTPTPPPPSRAQKEAAKKEALFKKKEKERKRIEAAVRREKAKKEAEKKEIAKKKAAEAAKKKAATAKKRAQDRAKKRAADAAQRKLQAQQNQLTGLLQQQLMACWNITTEAVRRATDVVVVVKLLLNNEGVIQSFQVINNQSTTAHRNFRTVKESVVQSLESPACRKMELPPELYTMWKEVQIRFSPRDAA